MPPELVMQSQPRSQGLSSYRPLGQARKEDKMRDPENEVVAIFSWEGLRDVICF